VTVGAIDSALLRDDIAQRFEATGKDAGDAAQIVAVLGAGHPQRTNLLAWHLWMLTGNRRPANAQDARVALETACRRLGPEFAVRWHALHGNERRVAVALANEMAPQGTVAQRATGLAGPGAAQRALQGVKSSGVAEVRDGKTVLTDPLFAEWLRARHSFAPPEPDWLALRRARQINEAAREGPHLSL
jgi:hypothetical protein